MGFRATLNFQKFKVALNPMYRTQEDCVGNLTIGTSSCCEITTQKQSCCYCVKHYENEQECLFGFKTSRRSRVVSET